MKRFFPLLLGLTFICLSFSYISHNTDPNSSIDCAADHSIKKSEDAVLSLAKVCRFHLVPNTSQTACSPVAAELVVNSNCVGTVKAYLSVTNLTSNPIPNNFYPLPTGVDDIFFEYTAFGTTQVIGPINSFEYLYDKDDQYNQTFHMYEAPVDLTFDVSSLCPRDYPTFHFEMKITDSLGNIYSVANNSSVNDIFYCGLFEESCNYCTHPPSSCPASIPGQELYFADIQACGVDCGNCDPPPHKNIRIEHNEVIAMEQELSTTTFVIEDLPEISMTTSPNPFTNEIRVTFNQELKSVASIQILDMTGKEVLTKENLILNSDSILVDTNDIPSGAYFCKVSVDNKILTTKIIKL